MIRPLATALALTLSACHASADSPSEWNVPTDSGLKVTVQTKKGRVVLSWRGKIAPPMAAAFHRAIREHRSRASDGFIVSLHSGGGKIREAIKVIRQLSRLRETHNVRTYVGPGRICGSACVPIYLQGNIRRASRASLWNFHEISSKDKGRPGYIILRPKRTSRFFRRFFLPAGVSGEWLRDLRGKIHGVDYWLTGADLEAEGSGIATQYSSHIRKRRKISRVAD